MTLYESMNLIRFQTKFSTEEACETYLFKFKWPEGFVCPKCGNKHFYKTKTRKLPLYECVNCHYQSTVTVGTIFEKTRTDLRKWFLAIYLLSHDKRGVSSIMLSKEIEVTYKTAWLMLHKIRKAMGERDKNYTLAGLIELDDAFFGATTEGKKRGRGTEKTTVLIGLSLNSKGHPKYLKMEVIDDVKGSTLKGFAKRSIAPNSTIYSDGYRSYNSLNDDFNHISIKFDLENNPDHLKWLHTIISNVKSFIDGTYHGLDNKHLQPYLDEFSYRFNRRTFKGTWFTRLLNCCTNCKTITYTELVV